MAGKIPDTIGKYKVIDRLAQGGMGAVYTALHPTLERTVIIKKLTLRGNADIRERFKREAQIMMDLRNDAIVDVYDHFREGSFYYIVLEYVDGVSLEGLIRERRYLPDSVALIVFREVCRGLAYAHERNVVHRDIKPANILISSQGEVRIVDFGIATIHGSEGNTPELTREGMTLGTPSYMAPEQFQSSRSVDRRADIYSLGVVLYEMVTGKRPYPGTFSPEVIARIQRGRYRAARSVNPRVTPFTNRLIRRMLRPRPERRFADVHRVIRRINTRFGVKAPGDNREIIKRYLSDESPAAIPRKRSRFTPAATAVVALLLAGAVFWGVSRGYHREVFQPREYGAVEVTARVLKAGRDGDGPAPTVTLYPVGTGGDTGAGTGAAGAGAAADMGDPENTGADMGDTEDHGADTGAESGPLRPVPEDETARFRVYRARRVVPAGKYWIEMSLEGTLHRRQIVVPPLVETRERALPIPGRRDDAHRISAEFLEVPELPLVLTLHVRDAATGRIVDDSLRTFVFINDRMRLFTRFTARTLRTGQEYRFRVEHPAYHPRVFAVHTKPTESHVILEVGLEPKE
jgi:serine/threonine-protein kinase